jgi:uncharacterized protein YodC (DUF2158 family)
MAEAIKAGDTVRFKSGGPLMTVKSVNADGAWCEWFDKKDEIKSGRFALSSLVLDEGGPIIV